MKNFFFRLHLRKARSIFSLVFRKKQKKAGWLMIHCPECGREIPERDFNVSTDLAFCSVCGTNYSYSELVQAENDGDVYRPDLPPRGIRVAGIPPYDEVLSYRFFSSGVWGLLIFGIIWCGMTGVFTVNIWFVEVTPWPVKLFLLPFQVIGLCILGAVLVTLFGRGELRVRDGMLETFAGIGGLGLTRRCDLAKIERVAIEPTSMRQNNRPIYGVLIRCDGRKRFVGRGLNDEKQQFIENFIRHHIRRNDARKKGFWA